MILIGKVYLVTELAWCQVSVFWVELDYQTLKHKTFQARGTLNMIPKVRLKVFTPQIISFVGEGLSKRQSILNSFSKFPIIEIFDLLIR